MKKFILPILGLAMAFFAFNFISAPEVLAQTNNLINAQDNPKNVSEATGNEASFRTILKRIVDYFLLFLGLIAVVMVIFGGFLYVTSAGNDANVEKGKNILIYAAIGIIIILISFALVNTLLGAAETDAGRANHSGAGASLIHFIPVA